MSQDVPRTKYKKMKNFDFFMLGGFFTNFPFFAPSWLQAVFCVFPDQKSMKNHDTAAVELSERAQTLAIDATRE